MKDELDAVEAAFDALRADTRRLDATEPLGRISANKTTTGQRAVFLGVAAASLLVAPGVVLDRKSVV